MQLQQIIQRRAILQEDRAASIATHEALLKATSNELAQLAEAETLIVGGLDHDRIERARKIINVYGSVGDVRRGRDGYGVGVRAAALAEAKADLANGGDQIGRRFFGVKNYDGFGDQRCDCEYGLGPRHGFIVFSIGLTRDLQQRVRTGPHLEDAEIEDALYLLSALPTIERLRAEQQQAAA